MSWLLRDLFYGVLMIIGAAALAAVTLLVMLADLIAEVGMAVFAVRPRAVARIAVVAVVALLILAAAAAARADASLPRDRPVPAERVEAGLSVAPGYYGQAAGCETLTVYRGGRGRKLGRAVRAGGPLRAFSDYSGGTCGIWLSEELLADRRPWARALLCGVLVHEYGHLLGWDHGAPFAVMDAPVTDRRRARSVPACWALRPQG